MLLLKPRNLLGSSMVARCLGRSRAFSASSDLVSTVLDEETGIATLIMQRPPVNSLSLEMCKALSESIKTAESTSGVKALILESSNPAIFSAGLDLMEMHKPDESRLEAFWRSFQQLYLDLYGSRLPCIAAMKGTAPAAGCMLALSCDYRILATNPKSKIGLNETKLGIVAPPWLARQFVDTVGQREAELGLSLGKLYPPQDALRVGLVDEVVEDTDQIPERAKQVALEFASVPPHAFAANKLQTRGEALRQLEHRRDEDIAFFAGFVTKRRCKKC